jgi:hypothetical protein
MGIMSFEGEEYAIRLSVPQTVLNYSQNMAVYKPAKEPNQTRLKP